MKTQEIDRLIKSGKWMIRTDNNGESYKGFTWKPLGQWTIAPDWDELPRCGGGLHGQNDTAFGCATDGRRLVLCEIDQMVVIDKDKVKTNKAKIVAINTEIPPQFLTKVSIDLRGCDLKGITLPQSIGGYLYLRDCDLKGITLPQSIGGYLDLSGCDLKGITLPQSIGGSLYLSGCDLKGITLPQSIGGSLDLSGCDLKGITIPQNLKERIK